MKEDTFTYSPENGINVFVRRWSPNTGIPHKGVIQIVHGMTEHGGRYRSTAEDLTKEGYIVYANDKRGCYRTAGKFENLGKWNKGTWLRIVTDQKRLTDIIKEHHPGLPIFLLGHSMGSMLAQHYIQQFGADIDGVILSGTNGKKSGLRIGSFIAEVCVFLFGEDTPGTIMRKLTLGKNNKDFEPSETEYDWFSRDPNVWKEFQDDPWVGFTPSYRFFSEMLRAMLQIWKPENEKRIPKDLPIYIFAGTMDPIGNKTKGVISLMERYSAHGISDISHKFYEDGRHDMLNEMNRDEVISDLLQWLNNHQMTTS